ncbi:MAG: DUF2922 domain-containing protein [Sarcina sp.]
MAKVETNLMLVFKDGNDTNVSLTLRNAQDGLDEGIIGAAMDEVIASGCILTSAGEAIVSKVKYAYIGKTITDLDVIA